MHNINKKVERWLRRLDYELHTYIGDAYFNIKTRNTWLGRDLLLTPVKEVDGEPVQPDKEYNIVTLGKQRVNYYKVMKKIFKQEGAVGVVSYCEQIKKDYIKKVTHEKTPNESTRTGNNH